MADSMTSRPPLAVPPARSGLLHPVHKGVLYASAGVFVFSLLNVLLKETLRAYPVNEVIFFRNFFALLPLAGIVLLRRGAMRPRPSPRLPMHLLRAMIGLCAMALLFRSFQMLPLADATALSFAQPLFLTALSVPLLGQRVGPRRWAAVVVGFIGVLIMLRPGSDIFRAAAVYGLGAALFMALAFVTVYRLKRTESSLSIIFHFALISTVLSALSLPFSWTMPSGADLFLLMLLGLCGALGQFLLTQSFQYAPAAVIGPFNYMSIVWAVIFGYLLWGEVPAPAVLLGGVVVIASGLYIVYRETRNRPA